MSREKQISVDEYRRKHKRCKTCVFASQSNVSWYCCAKCSSYVGRVSDYKLKGCCCKLYKAEEFQK